MHASRHANISETLTRKHHELSKEIARTSDVWCEYRVGGDSRESVERICTERVLPFSHKQFTGVCMKAMQTSITPSIFECCMLSEMIQMIA